MKFSRFVKNGTPSESYGGGADARNDADSAHVNVNAHAEKRNLHRTLFAVTIFVVMLALGLIAASCGKSGKSLVSSVNQSSTGILPVDVQNGDRVTMSIAGPLGGEFVFEPLDGDGTPDEKGEDAYQLKLKPGDGEGGSGSGGGDFGLKPTIELTITAKKDMGNSWKYALGYIEYDPEKYNPVEFIPGDLFGDDEKDVLNAALFQEKGRIAFWCGLKNFDKKDAKPGGEIGTFVIELVPWEPPKDASYAPNDATDRVDDLQEWWDYELEEMDRFLIWSEKNIGDGDLSGDVTIADYTPLALYDGLSVWNNPMLEPVDYNRDGDIDTSTDSYLIAQNLLETVEGYKVLFYLDEEQVNPTYSVNVGGPTPWTRFTDFVYRDGVEPGNPAAHFPGGIGNHYWAQNGAVGYCQAFEQAYIGQNIPYGTYYISLRPYDYDAENQTYDYGTESDRFCIFFNQERPRPTAVLHATPVGGYAPLTVTFDASASHDSNNNPVAAYSFDFDSDGDFEINKGVNAVVQYEYREPGQYHPRLVVWDSYDVFSRDDTLDINVAIADWLEMKCWRFNNVAPTEDDREEWGDTILQYCDSNGDPVDGIVVRASLRNTMSEMKNLPCVRLDFNMIEANNTPPVYFNSIFPQVYINSYDSSMQFVGERSETTGGHNFLTWTYNDQLDLWTCGPYSDTPLRPDGFFDPFNRFHEPADFNQGDNYEILFSGLPAFFRPVDEYGPGNIAKDVSLAYSSSITCVPPILNAEETAFDLFLRTPYTQIPSTVNGIDVCIKVTNSYYTDMFNDNHYFLGDDSVFRIRFLP